MQADNQTQKDDTTREMNEIFEQNRDKVQRMCDAIVARQRETAIPGEGTTGAGSPAVSPEQEVK